MDWQPIETAPKDGTAFIGAVQYDGETDWQIHEFEWCDHRGYFVRPYDEMPDNNDPVTHWMPFPAPPTK